MSIRQVLALCLCNAALYTGLAGLVGLLPVYLTRFGADARGTGFFVAGVYLCLALSTIVGGRLSDRFQHRKVFLIGGGTLAIPLSWFTGAGRTIATIIILAGCLWFVAGIAMTMVPILAGLFSEARKRGWLFGLLTLSSSLGLFFGGLVSGPIVDRWGYHALFAFLALVYLSVPGAGLFVPDKTVAPAPRAGTRHNDIKALLTQRAFVVLFVASIAGQAANVVIFLSRVLIMHSRHFDATAITSAAAFGGLVTLPLPLVIGRLADRLGYKLLLLLCFASTPLGLLILAAARVFWQFWVASALATILGVSVVVGSALVTDLFPEEVLGTALALLNATPWIGIVLGLSGGGLAIGAMGMGQTLVLSILLSLVALLVLLVLLPVSSTTHDDQVSTSERIPRNA